MVEHGHLGDHPADADPREVRRPPADYMPSEMTRQFTDANPDLARQLTDAIPIGRMGGRKT
jgi:hypothetical protein